MKSRSATNSGAARQAESHRLPEPRSHGQFSGRRERRELVGDGREPRARPGSQIPRPTGVSVNLEQQINESVGFFARAGYTDGSVEPWDFTDIDRTVQAGLSISGKDWGRPDDTLGFAGVINGLANSHEAYFAAGGLGILIGDGSLPAYGLEKILESYYNYALTPNIKVGVDYQLIVDPGYNATRDRKSLRARLYWQF